MLGPGGGLAPTFFVEGGGRVDAEALIRPVVEGAGFELVELVQRREGGRRIVQVTVDRDEPLDLEAVAEVSEQVSRRLDAEGFATGPYALEVSTPGLERALRGQAQFRRAIGSSVKVKTTVPVDGAYVHEGPLVGADDDGITVVVAGAERRLPLADIASARTVADWDAELRRSPRRADA
jgi:ribosome maturation factor RimP